MRSNKERQQDYRDRLRRLGFLIRTVYIHPEDWPAVKRYIEAKRKVRAADSAMAAHKGKK